MYCKSERCIVARYCCCKYQVIYYKRKHMHTQFTCILTYSRWCVSKVYFVETNINATIRIVIAVYPFFLLLHILSLEKPSNIWLSSSLNDYYSSPLRHWFIIFIFSSLHANKSKQHDLWLYRIDCTESWIVWMYKRKRTRTDSHRQYV